MKGPPLRIVAVDLDTGRILVRHGLAGADEVWQVSTDRSLRIFRSMNRRTDRIMRRGPWRLP